VAVAVGTLLACVILSPHFLASQQELAGEHNPVILTTASSWSP